MMIQTGITMRPLDKTSALARLLREAIVEGSLAPGDALPSERELMQAHQLSRTTVRRAIQLMVDEGVVVRRAGSGSYVADAPAAVPRAPVGAGTPTMSLIIPTFSNPLYGEMIASIEREARLNGLRLMTSQSSYSTESESAQLIALAADPSVRGAIVVPSAVDSPSPGALQFVAAKKPLVYMGRWPRDLAADGASTDYVAAARMAVEHLIELGHRHIAYAEGAPHLPGFSLLDGYQAALQAARLHAPASLVRIYDLESEAAGSKAVEELIASKQEFTAVFARNDVTAVGVMQALRKAGLRIPEDVAVASVNNSMLARSMTPLLTSVNIFPDALGSLAFRLLHERMEGIYQGPPIHISITPSLVIRRSTDGTSEEQ